MGATARLTLCGLCSLAALLKMLPPRRDVPAWASVCLLALVVLKFPLALASSPAGWTGEYAVADGQGVWHPARFHWRFASRAHRIDRDLVFDRSNIDLHFLNDIPIFGYPPYSNTPRELEFPLRARWRAQVTCAAPTALRLDSQSGVLAVVVDGLRREALAGAVELTAGVHQVDVAYDKPAATWPEVAIRLETIPGAAAPRVRAFGYRDGEWAAATILTTAGVWIGLAVMAFVTIRSYRTGLAVPTHEVVPRVAMLAVALVMLGWTAAQVVDSLGRTAFLHSGGDPLLYASDARDVLHGGPLMTRGKALGEGEAFYFYPFYPYVLAGVHALVGEDVSAIFLLNGLALAILPLFFWHLGWQRLRAPAAVVAAAALLGFLWRYCRPIAAYYEPSFTDILFLAVTFTALVALLRAVREPTPGRLFVAGVAMAIGTATRPSFLLLIGLFPVALWLATRAAPASVRLGRIAWLLAGVFVGVAPFTLRNLVVSGQFVVVVNSWIQIPYFLVPPEVTNRPGGIPTLREALAMAGEIIARDPLGALWVEVRKILFTLGYTEVGPPGMRPGNSLVVLPPLFLLALWLNRIPFPVAFVLVTFAVSHIAAMVLAAPWTFHLKSILPLHAAFLFGAAYLLNPRRGSTGPGSTTVQGQ